jgi:transposase
VTLTYLEEWEQIGSAMDPPKKRQQVLSKKKRGSHRCEKARRLVGKAHRNIRNQRRDFLHRQSRKLGGQHQTIVFEDVQLYNLVKRPKAKQDENGNYLPNGASAKAGLNTSILGTGWHMFVDMCSYKAQCASRNMVKVNPYKISQIYSACLQERSHKERDERIYICIHCGLVLDSDSVEYSSSVDSVLLLSLKQFWVHEGDSHGSFCSEHMQLNIHMIRIVHKVYST